MGGRANELLGYQRDARLLLLNADDLGMYPGVNRGIAHAIEAGPVRSASLIATSPWAPEAIGWVSERTHVSLGVHLTLVRDVERVPWGPLCTPAEVPSLVDADGRLRPLSRLEETLAVARAEEVEREFRAQLQAVLDAGLHPTHLDWHCTISGGRPDLFELTYRLAREHGLAVRVTEQPWIDRLQALGLPTCDHPLVDSYEVPVDEKPGVYHHMLRELPEGLSQWAMHPGSGDGQSEELDPDGWRIRRSDAEFLGAPETERLIRAEGIVLVDYRAIQAAWREDGVVAQAPA
ncbi:MAG TPA: ChbG/HpnK family deacetylase [Anaeromyxobacter sp.]|nr:ChbG/HpnK family deacetylase [Anaeromyxobacter sp.]